MPSAICDCTLNLLESHLNSLPKTWRVHWMGFISSLQHGSLKQCCRALVMHINPFFEGYNSSCECQVSFSIWLSQKLSLSPMTITSVSILLCVSDATSRSSVALENQSLAADLKFIQFDTPVRKCLSRHQISNSDLLKHTDMYNILQGDEIWTIHLLVQIRKGLNVTHI